jgi:regulator of sigma E protease
MEILIKVSQFILSLSLLIVLHELGHFIPAKLFKTKVEKFYLFFDPWFSLFKKKIGQTEYGIGWLPLGGYVKIAGMIDESMDTEQLKQPPQPWEFRSKPAWQRLIIMLGGVTVNVVLAFVIYAMMLFAWGKEYIPNDNLTYGVYADSLMLKQGFEHGDRILAVGGKPLGTLGEANQRILFEGARLIDLERNGAKMSIELPEDIEQDILRNGSKSGRPLFAERYPALIDSVAPGSAAALAGLKKGDQFVSLGGVKADSFQELVAALQVNLGREVIIEVNRNGETLSLAAEVSEDGKLGFYNRNPMQFFESEVIKYSFVESIPAGVDEGINNLVNYVRSLKLLFSQEGVKQVGGFLTIGNLFDNKWNWQRFWNMTALLSIILAVMNILPIPALDGGHVMFLLYEMVSGKQPPQKFMEYAQLVGLAILFTLILYANGMDIFRLFSNP